MDNNQIILISDALIFLLTFFYWVQKKRCLDIGVFLLFIHTVSHIGAFFYYLVLVFLSDDVKLSYEAMIYLYLTELSCFLPFLQHKGYITFSINEKEIQILQIISIILILLCLEPLCENIYLLFNRKEDYGELYDDMRDDNLKLYSYVGQTLIGWLYYFRIFVCATFFYSLINKDFSNKIKWGLLLVVANEILGAVNQGARGTIMVIVLLYVVCFLLIKFLLEKELINKIYKASILISIPLLIVFGAITMARYENDDGKISVVEWLLLYVSEGPIKFNNEMWEGEHNTNGDVNLCFYKDMVGMKTFTGFEERDNYYLGKNGRRIEVFYTFVGDFLSDFDYWGAIICCILLYLISSMLLRANELTISKLLLLLYIGHIYAIGFASNVYRSYGLQKSGFLTILLSLLLYYIHENIPDAIKQDDSNINSNGHL